uniref:Putative odorant-binding protein n=1 Tax=Triatoma brasiliensis TaxID=65344 RepID=A0A162X6J9_TRIBS|nr:putative odorant-binding protein [Triatoma brasiliensis]
MAYLKTVLYTLAVLYVALVSGYKEELRATMKSCKNGQDVTDAEIEEFMKPLIPTTDEEKCLMACVFKAFNVIDNGHYDPKLALAVAQDLLKSEPEKVQKIKNVIDHCGDDIPKQMDNECELASEIMQCVAKYEREVGIL